MATPPANSFSASDFPGDIAVVLVLIEGSGNMLRYWDDIRGYLLPILLDALLTSHPDIPMRIVWQIPADPYDQSAEASTIHSTYSESHRLVPNLPFDTSLIGPLSPSNVRTSIETMRAATPQDRSSTRHLIVIAMSPPLSSSPGLAQTNVYGAPENWQSIATMLYQDRVRLHMILNSSSHLDILRDFHRNALNVQSRSEAPLWFQVNPRYSVHLAAKNIGYGSGGDSPLPVPATTTSFPSNPVTPARTSASLPTTSPIHESPTSNHSSSSSPPSRRPRPGSRESLVQPPLESGSPGLVNYLKQMHGLTKKRTPGGKAAKKPASTDAPRASSSRPILPRLELPPANVVAAATGDFKGRSTELAALEAASSGSSRYAPIAPAISPTKPTTYEDARRAPARRWPWLQPAPLSSSAETPNLSPGTAAALRNLQAIAPRMPELSTQLHGEQLPSRSRNDSTRDASPSRSGTTIFVRAQTHRQTTYPPYGIPAAPQSDDPTAQRPYRRMSGDHQYPAGDIAYSSHARSPVMQQQSASARTYPAHQSPPQHYATYQYPSHSAYLPHPGGSPPLHSASNPGPSSEEDTENQPFLITAEYEAIANAEFEEAVRSGAMQASMTPTVLSPVASSPIHGSAGYFALDPASTSAMMPPPLPQTPTAQSGYPYAQSHDTQLGHDASYGQSPVPRASTTSTPPGNMGYYSPSSGDEHDGNRWYGA